MNEELFLEQLKIQLKDLPADEVAEIIADYEAYFVKARRNGLTDEEAVENLGQPREVVQDILAQRQKTSSKSSNSRSTLIAIALIFFNVTILLGPVIGLIGAYFGLVVATFAFIISPLLVLFKFIVSQGSYFELFFSLLLCGIGIIILPYFKLGGKIGYEILQKYYRWNIDIVRGNR